MKLPLSKVIFLICCGVRLVAPCKSEEGEFELLFQVERDPKSF